MDDPHLVAATIIKQNRYLSLGTIGPDGPWVAPVAFAVGIKFSLLFYSATEAKHSQNIQYNPEIAGAVFDSTASSETVDGVQFSGLASVVPVEELADARDRYFRMSFPDKAVRAQWIRPIEDFMDDAPQRFYRIELKSAFKLDLRSIKVDRRLALDVDELKNALWDLEFEEDVRAGRLDHLLQEE